MKLQSYAEPIARTQKWRTTEQGLTVSGAKAARFTREAVEQAFSALRDRIHWINNALVARRQMALFQFQSHWPQ
jgi:hypothetical protein